MSVGRNRNKITACALGTFFFTVWLMVFTSPYMYYDGNLGPMVGFVYAGTTLVSCQNPRCARLRLIGHSSHSHTHGSASARRPAARTLSSSASSSRRSPFVPGELMSLIMSTTMRSLFTILRRRRMRSCLRKLSKRPEDDMRGCGSRSTRMYVYERPSYRGRCTLYQNQVFTHCSRFLVRYIPRSMTTLAELRPFHTQRLLVANVLLRAFLQLSSRNPYVG